MKHILIAIDYNPSAQKVAETAYAFFPDHHNRFTLLHVLSNPDFYQSSVYSPIMGFGGYVDLDFISKDIAEDIRTTSYIYLEKIRQHLGGENIFPMVKEGAIADVILEQSTEHQVDAIVMGSHSRNWIEHALLGSSAESVLRKTKIPLIIVPVTENDR